jgi:hypothetical protein
VFSEQFQSALAATIFSALGIGVSSFAVKAVPAKAVPANANAAVVAASVRIMGGNLSELCGETPMSMSSSDKGEDINPEQYVNRSEDRKLRQIRIC